MVSKGRADASARRNSHARMMMARLSTAIFASLTFGTIRDAQPRTSYLYVYGLSLH